MAERMAASRIDADGTSLAKKGKGDHIFLAFVGRARRPEGSSVLAAKSDPVNHIVGLVVLLLFGGMIGLVIWRLFFDAL